MTRTTIRWVTALGILSIIALLSTQGYWLMRAYTVRERQFSQNVSLALKEAADDLRLYNGTQAPLVDPVDQLDDNYYVVMVNDVIDANVLEHFLTRSLEKRGVVSDFEYGVYDCNNEHFAYGNYVSLGSTDADHTLPSQLPVLNKENYYFGVFFPHKTASLIGELRIFLIASALTLGVVVFFGYALFIIFRQKRLSEIQKDFINNMTHEFKTPISTIVLSSEVLSREGITAQPERLASYAGIIREEATRLLGQVERVLQMARTDREQINLNRERVNLKTLVHEVLSQKKLALEAASATVELDLAPDELITEGDPLHLSQVLLNLLDNAIKYSPEAPKIHLRLWREGKQLRIAIRDEGQGLSKEELRRIFDKFYRVPTGDRHDVKGFGLGLAYVKRMMAAHRGRVAVSSVPGEGSTFTLTLPAV